jgi:hypothetical protein
LRVVLEQGADVTQSRYAPATREAGFEHLQNWRKLQMTGDVSIIICDLILGTTSYP